MPSVALRHVYFQRLERGWLKEEGGKGEALVMRRKFTAPGWEHESSFWKIKLLSGNKQHKVKVYEFKDLKWTLIPKGRKEIHRKYVERSQNGQETWRTGLSQGARTESGEVRLGWVEMCVLPISSSLHIGPDQQAENWQWRVVQLYWSKLQEHSRSKLQEQSGEPLFWIRLQKFLEASS